MARARGRRWLITGTGPRDGAPPSGGSERVLWCSRLLGIVPGGRFGRSLRRDGRPRADARPTVLAASRGATQTGSVSSVRFVGGLELREAPGRVKWYPASFSADALTHRWL